MQQFPKPKIIHGPDKVRQVVNGARGRARGATHAQDPFRYVVGHTYQGGENFAVERFLNTVGSPAFPPNRCFQSKHPSTGEWLWETVDGRQTTDVSKAKPVPAKGVKGAVYRGSPHAPLVLKPGDPMPWCYGPGYMAFTDGLGGFVWTCDPELFTPNAQGGKPNFYGLSICMPGLAQQSREQWLDAKSLAHIRGFAKFIVECHRRFGIPLERVTPAQLKAGGRGYCGHGDISKAFGGTHYDPGYSFPWDVLAQYVLEESTMYVTVLTSDGKPDVRLWVQRDWTLYRLNVEQEGLALFFGAKPSQVRAFTDLKWFSNIGPDLGPFKPTDFRIS